MSWDTISIRFKSGLWLSLSKTLLLFFLEPFRGGLAGEFGIIALLHNPSVLELEFTNWWPDILLQDFLIESKIHSSISYGKSSRSWSCKAAPDHHTTINMFDCWCNVLFMKSVGFMQYETEHTLSKNVTFVSSIHRIFAQKSWGQLRCFGKCETSLCVLFGQYCLLP